MSAHPRDEWVEFRMAGDAAPIPLLLVDGREAEVAEAKALYVADRLSVVEFEQRVEEALRPRIVHLCVDNEWHPGCCAVCLDDLRRASLSAGRARA